MSVAILGVVTDDAVPRAWARLAAELLTAGVGLGVAVYPATPISHLHIVPPAVQAAAGDDLPEQEAGDGSRPAPAALVVSTNSLPRLIEPHWLTRDQQRPS